MYSGGRVDPAAVIFVPKQKMDDLELPGGWTSLSGPGQLEELIQRMQDRFDPLLKVWALAGHAHGAQGQGELLGYLYSSGRVSVTWSAESERYVVHPVTGAFNPKYDTI